MDNNTDYTYTSAGFDGFLMRSIDKTPQVNLSDPGPVSKSVHFDRMQVSGMLGDTLQLGQVTINRTNIVINDGQNDRLILGEAQGAF